jgi:hypothetical protein
MSTDENSDEKGFMDQLHNIPTVFIKRRGHRHRSDTASACKPYRNIAETSNEVVRNGRGRVHCASRPQHCLVVAEPKKDRQPCALILRPSCFQAEPAWVIVE